MKRIVVLGGGISGYGSAILAKKKGFDVFLSDSGRIADRYKARLDEWAVPYEEGGHTEERILAADEVVKSPGIPEKAPVVRRIREAGIVGMGGATFPTHVKLAVPPGKRVEYLIINGVECEPYLTSDHRVMLERGEELLVGVTILMKAIAVEKAYIGIENNKPDAIAHLRKLAEGYKGIEVVPLKVKYPQGGERQLIYAVTGRSINSGMLPADAGCIVDNVETLVAIYQAVRWGKPVMNRIFTVTGDAVSDPRNFYVCTGTNYQEILDAAGGCKVQPEKMIAGGPMMGFALFGLDIPATKTSSALLCMTKDEVAASAPTACINCGRCVDACPELLIPSRLAKFSDYGDKEIFEKWNGMECVECGSCSFICPARRQLAQSIKTMKKNILADRRKK